MRTVTGGADRIVVVGAGFAGLAAALRLTGGGREVVVCEQAAGPGGKAGVFTRDGYVFDTGPTVLTMPELLAEAFGWVGEDLADWLELEPVDPIYRAHYADGSTLDVTADEDRMAAEISAVCGAAEADGYRRYVSFLRELYQCQYHQFIDRNMDGLRQLLSPSAAKLLALGGFRNLDAKAGRYLHDPRTRKVFTFQALYAGAAPHRARALYAVISYLDTVCGVFRAKGGVHQLPVALAAAAGKHGVDFRYNTTITGTERTRSGRVNAVVTAEGERIEADAVVFTCDPGLAYPLLGRPTPRLTYSPSCFLMLAGVAGPHGVGAHHNLHFGDAWRTTFDEIITQGKTMSDPSFLVTVSSHGDPTMAPAGKHSYYVQFPAPNTAASDLDWSTFAAPYRDHVVATLERRGYANIGSAIEFEEITTPLDWRRRGNPAGTPYNAAHTFWQTGPFRTSNLVGRNVVLAGAGTHPGIGVPMAMLSGKLAAARILGVDRA